jgi:site-specific recombinase XerD
MGHQDRGIVYHLAQFDRFLWARKLHPRGLSRAHVEKWASSDGPLKPASRAKRLHSMRILGRFIAQTHPRSYVPGRVWGPRQTSGFRPHIYTKDELALLIGEAAKLSPPGSLRPKTYVTLFSLLYSTGLRISEALALTFGDVDLQAHALLIRESKFHKSRMVPLHPTAADGLRSYMRHRIACGRSGDSSAPLFINQCHRPVTYALACATFLAVARRVGIRKPPGVAGPRIHDLRHSFAVARLLAWYRDGGDVQARLPLLTTYLGHVSIVSTQVYLEITAELLHEAARRFRSLQIAGSLKQGICS